MKAAAPLLIVLISLNFLPGCGAGDSSEQAVSVNIAGQWSGTWASDINSVINSGLLSMSVTQSGSSFGGNLTMSSNACSAGSVAFSGGTISGSTVSWTPASIGNFSGITDSVQINGTYSITSATSCLGPGETGTFHITKQ